YTWLGCFAPWNRCAAAGLEVTGCNKGSVRRCFRELLDSIDLARLHRRLHRPSGPSGEEYADNNLHYAVAGQPVADATDRAGGAGPAPDDPGLDRAHHGAHRERARADQGR